MNGTKLYAYQQLEAPIDEVFGFFSDAYNLEAITPAWLRFSVLTSRVRMGVGTRIDYRLRLYGLPIGWTSEITRWEPMVSFVDEQRRGPYRVWIHEHRFTPRSGRTLVEDFVRYAAPGGSIVDSLLVRASVRRIFEHRQIVLRSIFGSEGDAGVDTGQLVFDQEEYNPGWRSAVLGQLGKKEVGT